MGALGSRQMSFRDLKFRAKTAYIADELKFQIPEVPAVLHIDELNISDIYCLVWANIALSNVNLLPEVWRRLIQLLSFSGNLSLTKASINLEGIGSFKGLGAGFSPNMSSAAAEKMKKTREKHVFLLLICHYKCSIFIFAFAYENCYKFKNQLQNLRIPSFVRA